MVTELRRIQINGRFAGAKATGVQRVARSLIEAVDRRARDIPGLKAEVVLPRSLDHRLTLNNIPLRELGRLHGVAWEQLELSGDRRSTNLVNLCNAAPLTRRSALTMIHDAQVYLCPSSYSRRFAQWYRFSLPRIAQLSRVVLTVSNFSKQMLVRYGVSSADRIEVLHNGSDHMLSVLPERTIIDRLRLGGSSFVVGFGSLQDHKNLKVIPQAFQRPALRYLRLVLIGDLDEAAIVGKFGVGLPPGAVVAGRVTDGEMRALFERAICLVFPSVSEGFGLPPLEAMAVGCPAIVAPMGAVPEICGSAVLYADAHDPMQWVDAIADLAGDSELRGAMSSVGEAHASRFTWDASARRLLEILDDTAP